MAGYTHELVAFLVENGEPVVGRTRSPCGSSDRLTKNVLGDPLEHRPLLRAEAGAFADAEQKTPLPSRDKLVLRQTCAYGFPPWAPCPSAAGRLADGKVDELPPAQATRPEELGRLESRGGAFAIE